MRGVPLRCPYLYTIKRNKSVSISLAYKLIIRGDGLVKKSIGINMILNVLRQTLTVIFPLITYPYALRILGVVNIGKVNYGSSIITYFSMIASLGIGTYAVREGAKRKNEKQELSNFANQVFTINIISTLISYLVLFFSLRYVGILTTYTKLILIQSLTIVFTTMGVDWINSIFEDYLYITVRSIITHCISIVLLFVLVKSSNDYLLYAFLQVVTSAVVCMTNWIYCRKYIKLRITINIDWKKHLPPILILFANSLAISIYVSFDTIMLGWMKGDLAVGYYSAAVKIYTIIKNILMAIYIVTIPRLAYYIGEKEFDEYKKLFTSLWGKMTLILIPASVGVFMLAPQVMKLIGGDAYVASSGALRLLCFALIFSIYAGLVSPVLNVTIGREKENLIATLLGAGVNVVLNFYFIPKYSYVGAAFTTMISEGVAFIFPLLRIPSLSMYLELKSIRKSLFNVLAATSAIVISYLVVVIFIKNYLLIISFTIGVSVVLYIFILFILRDEYFIEVLMIVKKMLKVGHHDRYIKKIKNY